MGEVYRARDTRLGRDVAIKVLPAAFAGDPDRLYRFEQEARATAALNHPNILAVFDVGSGVSDSVFQRALSPDGKYVVAWKIQGEPKLFPFAGGEPRPIKGLGAADLIAGIFADDRTLLIRIRGTVPEKVFLLDTATGQRKLWKQIGPLDHAGVDSLGPVRIYHDGKAYIYAYPRVLSELYIFNGLR
jgi:hypothetical protein